MEVHEDVQALMEGVRGYVEALTAADVVRNMQARGVNSGIAMVTSDPSFQGFRVTCCLCGATGKSLTKVPDEQAVTCPRCQQEMEKMVRKAQREGTEGDADDGRS